VKKVLITGVAGFIGYHLAKALGKLGVSVQGIDNLNEYYDVSLKKARLASLGEDPLFEFQRLDICDLEGLRSLFREKKIERICHLAAQAGVRYSLENPFAYQKSNLEGFLNILECGREFSSQNLVYASSSSVYGKSTDFPFSEDQQLDHPISLYAATKKSNELMAHTYSHLFGLPTTGLRFFTVYGPFGRPDMALFLFSEAMLQGRPIQVFNHGKMQRDFTFVEDIVQGIVKALETVHSYEIFNLGNNRMVELSYFIACLEKELGLEAQKEYLPMQPGDVPKTCANIDHAKKLLGYNPKTGIEDGIRSFVAWYQDYYSL
jgi:UDP-glucuronate 4-epimerase